MMAILRMVWLTGAVSSFSGAIGSDHSGVLLFPLVCPSAGFRSIRATASLICARVRLLGRKVWGTESAIFRYSRHLYFSSSKVSTPDSGLRSAYVPAEAKKPVSGDALRRVNFSANEYFGWLHPQFTSLPSAYRSLCDGAGVLCRIAASNSRSGQSLKEVADLFDRCRWRSDDAHRFSFWR